MGLGNRYVVCCLLVSAAPLAAADGDFDPAFSGDGRYFYSAPGSFGSGMVRGPDDAVVVWGTRIDATSASEIHWRRVAVGGVGALCTFTPPGAEYVSARGAAFDADGRLLIVAAVDYGAGVVVGVLRVLYPSCDLDSDFDGGGFAVHAPDLGSGGSMEIAGVSTAAWYEPFPFLRRRVLVAIAKSAGSQIRNAWLLRLLEDGTLDSGFGGGDGVAMIAPDFFVRRIVPTFDGRYLLAATRYALDEVDTVVRRYDRSGVQDPAFGTGGEAVVDFAPAGDSADDLTRAVVVAPDGRIVLAGSSDLEAQPGIFASRGALAVLTRDGAPDPTFSADGRTLTAGFGYSTYGTALAVQGDGRILLATSSQEGPPLPLGGGGNDGSGHVHRFTRGGGVDASFGAGGRVAFDWDLVPDGADGVLGVALAEDGRIWASGAVETPVATETDQKVWVARLLNSYVFADGFERGSSANW